MGVCCGKLNKEFYIDADNESERNIRIWEESIGAFKHTFSYLRHKTRFEQNLVSLSIAKSFFKKEFSSSLAKFIEINYFKENEFLSRKKLEGLIFLLARPEIKETGTVKYFDKSTYVIQEVLLDEEDDMNTAIEQTDENLRNFIMLLLDITFELTEFYKNENDDKDSEYIKEITLNKSMICKSIIANMFKREKSSDSFAFDNADLTTSLLKNKWFLTPGYFREEVYELAKAK